MANFVNVDRRPPMRLPMDVRDWVPEDGRRHRI